MRAKKNRKKGKELKGNSMKELVEEDSEENTKNDWPDVQKIQSVLHRRQLTWALVTCFLPHALPSIWTFPSPSSCESWYLAGSFLSTGDGSGHSWQLIFFQRIPSLAVDVLALTPFTARVMTCVPREEAQKSKAKVHYNISQRRKVRESTRHLSFWSGILSLKHKECWQARQPWHLELADLLDIWE